MKLIFIHGSGSYGDAWHYQTEHFPDADAIDLPGHPDGELCTSIEAYVEWLKGYIDGKGYRDVVLAGHSLGGAIAQLYALTHPGDLAGLILIGTGARLRVHPTFLEALEKAKDHPTMFAKMREMGREDLDPDMRQRLREKDMEVGAGAALSDMQCCDRFDIMDRVHEIAVPTLVLCGSVDEMTPPKYGTYLAEKIAGARQVMIEGGTHSFPQEKPEEVNRAIDEFLASLPAAA